jgi:signal peptidase I
MDEATTEGAAAGAAALHPELASRLASVEQERLRREKLRARVAKERRVLLPLLALALLCLPNFRLARVVGHSMEPAFQPGHSLLVLRTWRWFSPLHPGDIVVFQKDGQELVKRVVFVQNPQGTAVWPTSLQTSRGLIPIRPHFFEGGLEGVDRQPPRPGVPQRVVYVLGDNWEVSDDSRSFGPIALDTVLGKVVWARPTSGGAAPAPVAAAAR